MKGKATSTKDKNKVIKLKLEDPELSSTDIEKLTGINYVTVTRILNEVPEIVEKSCKDSKLQREIQGLEDIVSGIRNITERHINEVYKEKTFEPKDLKNITVIGKVNWERSQILQNKPTENKKLDFNFKQATTQEIEEMIKELLK